MMNNCLSQYYRCPEDYGQFVPKDPLHAVSGYFSFGKETTCYGACSGRQPAEFPTEALHDASYGVEVKGKVVHLPFDPSEVIDNLRRERYVEDWRNDKPLSAMTEMYYLLRPILPVGIRRHLQKVYLHGWERISFPHWPVDTSVDNLLEQLLLLSIRSTEVEHIPFIWFWPERASSCAIMTHDVETAAGRDFCQTLMDIDDSVGVKASFQVIPEERYRVDEEFLSSIRSRGFEIVVHDLNHDGHLYKTRKQFRERAAKINAYGREYRAKGFRAGVLYRKQLWYDALDFEYDMSVPNVAHLDPQRGGCCTVMPYFLGNLLELPVTTTQDYSLFNILNDYSTNLWERQIELIMEKHGLMSFVVHPDYIMSSRECNTYQALLNSLVRLREEKHVWITTPGDVNQWWRQRAGMTLVERGDGWEIEGAGKERARIAYAREEKGRLAVTFQEESWTNTDEFSGASHRS
jgi:hypothetical protein